MSADARNYNLFAVGAQDSLEALQNDAGALPVAPAFPATMGAFVGLNSANTQQLLTFYGLAHGAAGLQTPKQRLARHIGLRIAV